MKKVQIWGFMLLVGVICVAPAVAQKKAPRKSSKAKATTTIAPLDVRTAREKVDIQLSNVQDFLDKLGPTAVSMETAIADQQAGRLRPETSRIVDAGRAKLVASIRGLRDALTPLESDFRTKSALQKYLPTVEGITDLSHEAEDSAIAGQFIASKEPLRKIVQKLTDALAVMPR
jgi:hypothetical protein